MDSKNLKVELDLPEVAYTVPFKRYVLGGTKELEVSVSSNTGDISIRRVIEKEGQLEFALYTLSPLTLATAVAKALGERNE